MRRFVLSCLAASAAVVAAGPARADFAECVASLRAEASRAGISAKTLDAAFNGLQPDMKVLDLQQRQLCGTPKQSSGCEIPYAGPIGELINQN